MSVYVVDSNFFIQAHRANYPLDVALSFWAKVQQLAHEGKIISIDKVKDELYNKNDELEAWCRAKLPEDFFKSTDEVMTQYSQVISWAVSKSGQYNQNALNEFLSSDEADAFLIAYTLADNANRILVTHETSSPNSKSRIKIPDVCMGVNVRFANTIDMLRQLGESF